MSELVFLAETNSTTQKYFDCVASDYTATFVQLDQKAASAIELEKPKLILIFVNYLLDSQKEIADTIMMNTHNVPFIVAGTREACNAFNKAAQSDIVGYLITPVSEEEFNRRVKTIWKNTFGKKLNSEEEEIIYEKPKKKILIVDDDAVCLRQMMNILKGDFIISVVKSGKACLDYLTRDLPNLILLDYAMPEMSGVETLRKIRENPRYALIPVIFLTGVQNGEMVREALSCQPQGYLLKTLGSNVILSKINSVLQNR